VGQGADFAKAGLHDFRRHDFRHTFASRLGRATGARRKVQVALDHQDITSTVKYRHVTENEITEARASVTVLPPERPGIAPEQIRSEGEKP